MEQTDLSGKCALVTGADSGIGEAIVRVLAERGARVANNYVVDAVAAETLARSNGEAGSKAVPIKADVTDAVQVAEMFRRTDAAFNGIDILVNSAGIDGPRQLSWDAELGQRRRVVEVNLFGAIHCRREALARMVPQGSGVILSVTSVHEAIPWTGYSAYTTAKAGLSTC